MRVVTWHEEKGDRDVEWTRARATKTGVQMALGGEALRMTLGGEVSEGGEREARRGRARGSPVGTLS